MKRTLVLDIECYVNYFLVMFKSIDTRKVVYFEWPLDRSKIIAILREYRIVTFNGSDYDLPLLTMALRGDKSLAELKAISNRIIESGMRSWQFEREYEIRIPEVDHIDLKEPVPGVMISLKLYGARLHSKHLQDLPIEHTAVITPEQIPLLRSYCENDLDTTIDLFLKATDPKDNIIETREHLSAEYGIDLRSKSDAQIAEAAIRAKVQQLKGEPVYRQDVLPGTSYRYIPPKFLRFNHPVLRSKFAEVLAAEFIVKHDGGIAMPPALDSTVTVGRSTFKMGIGGLHSTEKSVGHVGTPDVLLRDVDVVSYYPSLILQCGLFPRNMGEHFQRVYNEFFHNRVSAKKAGHKSVAQTLKIVLNGSFGKLGSKWSVLYSPDLLIQVTVTGQLALLMLIERYEAAGIPVISANTDGVVAKCPAHLEATRQQIVKQWEHDTGLETEETKYRALFSRDVNNYIALYEKGGYKVKGTLVPPGVQKNPDNEIVALAVAALLDKGTPIGETIFGCRDVRKFLRVKRVTGGAKFGDQYLGRVVRWYRRAGETRHIEYVTNGNKVGGSDGACPLMTLPDTLPTDIDYDYYLREANDLLREIGACV